MKEKTPSKWVPYLDMFPLLEEAIHWEPLRQWSLSDVWRINLGSGKTIIAKLGNGSMARELEIYQSVLDPVDIPRPYLYKGYRDSEINAFLMEDLGRTTVEGTSTALHFTNAARQLARIREITAKKISSGILDSSVFQAHFKPLDHFIQDIKFVLQNYEFQEQELKTLNHCLNQLPKHLIRLYEEYPVTITHNDYNAKNLMVVEGSIIPIDWSNAYLSPHLGDLFCLISEAQECGFKKSEVVEAFQEQYNVDSIEWMIQIGGICWEISGLRWVCEEGIHKVPGTDKWVPMMISEINKCIEKL